MRKTVTMSARNVRRGDYIRHGEFWCKVVGEDFVDRKVVELVITHPFFGEKAPLYKPDAPVEALVKA